MAGLYNGHLIEFPQIRVDCFTTPTPSRPHLLPTDPSSSTAPWRAAPNARLYLLTHVHTDHLTGLSNTFTGKIICSPDTKRMLLRLEAEVERERVDGGLREEQVLKYDGLKSRTVGEGKSQRKIDMIEAIPYGDSRDFELGYEDGEPYKVTITLLDANHCPGSTMFLIQSKTKAVLHTGDVRADSAFIQSLRHNPAVAQFVEPPSAYPHASTRADWGKRSLDRIYIDTSAVLGTGDMPDREPVLTELVEQMSMYPPDTVFFLNVWCFGWEDVVKAVARHFRSPIHVDRYKRSIYGAVKTDSFLLACTTSDAAATRFHACERRFKCDHCRTFDKTGRRVHNVDKRIVHVNMVEVKSASWEIEQLAFRETLGRAACGEADWPFNIRCPIARHSPLPELQALVQIFAPRNVSPNCVVPSLGGLDYFLLPNFLDGLLQLGGLQRMISERDAWFHSRMCFIRDGPSKLASLVQQQAQGTDLLSSLDAVNDERNVRDDFLLDGIKLEQVLGDIKPNLGFVRRHTADDQARRAGGLLSPAILLPATDLSLRSTSASQKSHPDETASLSDTDQEDLSERRRRTARGPGKRKHLVSPSVARSRVLSLSRHATNKRMKTEPNDGELEETKLSITMPEPYPDVESSLPLQEPKKEPVCPAFPDVDTSCRPSRAAAPRSRYLVDSNHLAALMAVGEVPPLPSPS